MTAGVAFKILTAMQWAAFERDGTFCGAPVDVADGYIHLSTAEQLDETLAKHFAGQDGLVIAEVSLDQLGGAVRWEVSRGGALFPHLYAALPMSLTITPSDQACGASVTGVDLARPLDATTIAEIRAAWLEHHVLAFPGQRLSDDDLEHFTQCFGSFGDDPFIKPIVGRKHVIAVKRRAAETSPLFAENWHSDWSFQARPPAGTCLYGITIPPVGGNTEFANQHAALEAMPDRLRAKIEGKMAVHSARGGYAPSGMYGAKDKGRSMDIRSGQEALATQLHPFIRRHPETGREGLYGCAGYIMGIDGMADAEALPLLYELLQWQGRAEFRYSHRWEPAMLVMWDNRSLLHRATGGYDGHDRLLHRTTIAAWDG